MAGWREPMLAQPLKVPDDLYLVRRDQWSFERKLDGLRCLAVREGHEVGLWSRNRLSFLRRFPDVADALRALPADRFTIDGELVVFDGDRTSFQLLQNPEQGSQALYCVFDLLDLLGKDTTVLPLEDRQGLLRQVVEGGGPLLVAPEVLDGDPEELLAHACGRGWEGLVAKRAGSPYRAGRSPDWRKLKCTARQEFVIGGWTEPTGSRTGFGALLLGYYRDDGAFLYSGKVGTGFDERTLRSMYPRLIELERPDSPFAETPKMRNMHWVQPHLVAEIAFTEWTRDRRLRHPSFLGLREDKAASEVRIDVFPD